MFGRADERANLPAPEDHYRAEPATGVRIGVACSGGGIRSAAFNLGALQALQERGLLEHVDYLAAVSGGNYIASALAITAAESDEVTLDCAPLWSHGSPEERHLRHHTDYLAPGLLGRLWLLLNVLYGFIVNYLPFLLGAFILGRLMGWTLNVLVGSRSEERILGTDIGRSRLVSGVLLICAVIVIVIGLTSVLARRIADGRGHAAALEPPVEEYAAKVFAAGIVTVLAVVLVPTAIELYRSWSQWILETMLHQEFSRFETSPQDRMIVAFVSLLVALVLAGAALMLSRRSRARRSMLMLAAFGASGMLLIPFLSSLEYSSRHGIASGYDVLSALTAAAILLFMAAFVHNRRYSMHLFYRERLCSAYAVARRTRGGVTVARPLPYGNRIWFSQLGEKLDDARRDADICWHLTLSSAAP